MRIYDQVFTYLHLCHQYISNTAYDSDEVKYIPWISEVVLLQERISNS